MIFSTYAFPNNNNAIEFIQLLPNAQDKQQAQQEIAEILRQKQECQGKQFEIWYSFFIHEKTWYDVGESTSWEK